MTKPFQLDEKVAHIDDAHMRKEAILFKKVNFSNRVMNSLMSFEAIASERKLAISDEVKGRLLSLSYPPTCKGLA